MTFKTLMMASAATLGLAAAALRSFNAQGVDAILIAPVVATG